MGAILSIPASIATTLATQAACCFGQAACSSIFNCCGSKSSTATRVGYSLLFLMTSILSYIMLTDWLSEQLKNITFGYFHIPCVDGKCSGVLSVYRLCFTNTLFHFILALGMYNVQSSKDWRSNIQNGYWAFKFMAWFSIAALSFYIPSEFFIGFAKYVNMPGASIFILIQVILLIDFAYTISGNLLSLWEETEDKRYLGILVFITFSSFVFAIVITGLAYAWYGTSQCPLNQFFISLNWILCLLTSLISVMPLVQENNPKSGLAQAAMVTIYATYLVASAIVSEPDTSQQCGPGKLASTETSSVIIGSLFTFVALVYSTSSAATQGNILAAGEDVPLLASEENESNVPTDDETEGVVYSYTFFHFIFVLGSMYLAMLLTNWDTVTMVDKDFIVGKSITAVWVKIVSSWCVLILYGWTLVAPLVLPDRSWD